MFLCGLSEKSLVAKVFWIGEKILEILFTRFFPDKFSVKRDITIKVAIGMRLMTSLRSH
jgi:hypothetical protein